MVLSREQTVGRLEVALGDGGKLVELLPDPWRCHMEVLVGSVVEYCLCPQAGTIVLRVKSRREGESDWTWVLTVESALKLARGLARAVVCVEKRDDEAKRDVSGAI